MCLHRKIVGGLLLVAGMVLIGCGTSAEKGGPAATATQVSDTGHDHSGWWCSEHGVPEEVCALCNKKIAADFKAKGDWCKEHDRPESQCFICHPEKEAEFAALYEAKYGEKPPAASEGHGHEGGEHAHEHGSES